jgi:hypothetical protein
MLAVVAYGVVLVYLLGSVPVICVCILKGEWAMIFAGFLTFGLVWWIGAAAGESRRRLGIVAAMLACAVLGVGVVAGRPGQFFGVGGRSLERSVGGTGSGVGPCRNLGGREWSCVRSIASDYREYRVRVSPLGCWRGVEEAGKRLIGTHRIAGCVHIDDYL